MPSSNPEPETHKRRARYSGKHPRRFEDKYKEQNPEQYPDAVAHVIASGKTPAGMHLPIMLDEVLEHLQLVPGKRVVDCTVGYGGHSSEILQRIEPSGILLGLDLDPVEIKRTEARMRAKGYSDEALRFHRSNFAGLPKILVAEGWNGADAILADLGVSSMQLDTPDRGFSFKHDGPLDMRMNPGRGLSAADWLSRAKANTLSEILRENADEPCAEILANALAGKHFPTTQSLRLAILNVLAEHKTADPDKSVRRVFQALRIAVNEEFSALESWLRVLPDCLLPGGRVVVLTFHSGEDRRVKYAFREAFRKGEFDQISETVFRPTAEECRANPRSTSAKLRWAQRAVAS